MRTWAPWERSSGTLPSTFERRFSPPDITRQPSAKRQRTALLASICHRTSVPRQFFSRKYDTCCQTQDKIRNETPFLDRVRIIVSLSTLSLFETSTKPFPSLVIPRPLQSARLLSRCLRLIYSTAARPQLHTMAPPSSHRFTKPPSQGPVHNPVRWRATRDSIVVRAVHLRAQCTRPFS